MTSQPLPALVLEGATRSADQDAQSTVHRGRLFRKYLLLILSLVTGALLASGAISIYFSYQENKSALAEPAAREGARRGVADRAVHPPDRAAARLRGAAAARRGRRRAAPHRVPEAAAPGAGGHRHRAARRRRPRADRRVAARHGQRRTRARTARRSRRFAMRSAGRPWFGPVYFRKETEPYMTIAHPLRQRRGTGDDRRRQPQVHLGRRVADQDRRQGQGVRRRRQRLSWSPIPTSASCCARPTCRQLAARARRRATASSRTTPAMVSTDLAGTPVLTSVAPIESLGLERVRRAAGGRGLREAQRVDRCAPALLLLAGLVISALGALALARGMVRPIRTLDEGARRIGAGELDQKIDVRTGDELRGARRPVQPDDGAVARIVCGPRAQGRRAHARAHELARAADGDQRDPARDLELADRRAAGAARRSPSAPRTCATRRSRGCCSSTATCCVPMAGLLGASRSSLRAAVRCRIAAHVDHRPRRARPRDRPSSPTSLPLLDTEYPGRDARTSGGSAAARCWRCR